MVQDRHSIDTSTFYEELFFQGLIRFGRVPFIRAPFEKDRGSSDSRFQLYTLGRFQKVKRSTYHS